MQLKLFYKCTQQSAAFILESRPKSHRKEQLQEHRKANCRAPAGNGCPVVDTGLCQWNRVDQHTHNHKNLHKNLKPTAKCSQTSTMPSGRCEIRRVALLMTTEVSLEVTSSVNWTRRKNWDVCKLLCCIGSNCNVS